MAFGCVTSVMPTSHPPRPHHLTGGIMYATGTSSGSFTNSRTRCSAPYTSQGERAAAGAPPRSAGRRQGACQHWGHAHAGGERAYMVQGRRSFKPCPRPPSTRSYLLSWPAGAAASSTRSACHFLCWPACPRGPPHPPTRPTCLGRCGRATQHLLRLLLLVRVQQEVAQAAVEVPPHPRNHIPRCLLCLRGSKTEN